MWLKIIIVLLIGAILVSLGNGLFHLSRPSSTHQVAKAMTWRVVLSLSLYIFLMLAFVLHWIRPHLL